MRGKVVGLLLTVIAISVATTVFASTAQYQVMDADEKARYLYSQFEAITSEQHHAFSQRAQVTDAQLKELLGINNHRRAIVEIDRDILETLTDQELDALMTPFMEILCALNARYGTDVIIPYLYQMECWRNPDSHRETFLRILSGETTFDVWFSAIRENIDIAMRFVQHNAHAAMVIDGRLSVEEFTAMYTSVPEYEVEDFTPSQS